MVIGADIGMHDKIIFKFNNFYYADLKIRKMTTMHTISSKAFDWYEKCTKVPWGSRGLRCVVQNKTNTYLTIRCIMKENQVIRLARGKFGQYK